MKLSPIKLYLLVFFLMLGKSVFDLHTFTHVFSIQHLHTHITEIIAFTGIFSLVMVTLFNYLQRAFVFTISMAFTYLAIFSVIVGFFFLSQETGLHPYMPMVLSVSMGTNFLILLLIRGLQIRIGEAKIKQIERSSNLAGHIALVLGGGIYILLLVVIKEHNPILLSAKGISSFSAGSIFVSLLFLQSLAKKDKRTQRILDNLQEVKVNQKLHKLLTSRYFISILTTTALASASLAYCYSLFITTNISHYANSWTLLKILGISVVVYALLSIAYELFLKEKAFYNLSIKIHLILMPVLLLAFGIIYLVNTFHFKITPGNELFFFIPIVACVFLVVSHYSFINLFMPVVNNLFLPVNNGDQSDFYTKSCYWGFSLGLIIMAASSQYILPQINLINNSGYVVMAVAIVLLSILINRYLIYSNYKAALQDKLQKEAGNKTLSTSFIETTINKLATISGHKIIRLINLIHIINPVETKKALHSLASSDDVHIQRAGLVSAIRLYLLEIYDKMHTLSCSKYFPSSPNRDKIELLLARFEGIKTKMQKSYYVRQLSISKHQNERVHGAILANYAPEEERVDILKRLVNDSALPVAKNAIVSASGYTDKELVSFIIDKLGTNELSNASYACLLHAANQAPDLLEEAFYKTGQTEKVQLRIVRLLGDMANEKAVEYLLKKLSYPNQNIISASLEALSKTNFTLPDKKAVTIKHELEEVCKYIVWNTSLILDLERHKGSGELAEAMEVEIQYNYKSLFDLLSLLFNPGSIELIRKNLWHSDYQKVAFALELASLIIANEAKPMILPLLRPMSKSERIKKMQAIFVTEKMSHRDVLYDIIQRDYKWINPWTKACAIMELARLGQQEDLSVLLGNMVNPDPMIAELAALSVLKIDNQEYFRNKEIFADDFKNIIGSKSIQAIEQWHANQKRSIPLLKFEIIKYLQQVDEFKLIPGEILKHITDIITPLQFSKGQHIKTITNLDITNFHYIILKGEVLMQINGNTVDRFGENVFLSSLDLLIDYDVEISLSAETDAMLYEIAPSEFADILSFYDEIPKSIISTKNTTQAEVFRKVLKNDKRYQQKKNKRVA